MEKQSNCYNIIDANGNPTKEYIYASNITEAKKFKENSELWKKYGYYGSIKEFITAEFVVANG